MSRRTDEDDPDDLESEEEEVTDEDEPEDRPVRKPRRLPPRRRPPPAAPPSRPLRKWRSGGNTPEEEAEENERAVDAARRAADVPRPRYWTFRDSFWFAPVVAVVVIVVVLSGLVIYTGQWPPVYVVESQSMQHGASDQIGIINTGDLVLSKNLAYTSIEPYVVGLRNGYSTYGEYGDVVLYQPNGGSGTPVIHRAIVYLEYNPTNGTYNATELAGFPCGSEANAVYSVTPSLPGGGCATVGLSGTLTLYNIGWKSATVVINLTVSELGTHSGFVTLGDNNLNSPSCSTTCYGITDQAGDLSQLVGPNWVIGVARGMIPWFGALRLLISGNAGAVPPQSWEFLALTIVALILAGFGLHYAWSSVRPVDPRRAALRARQDAEEEAREAEEDPAEEETPRRRWFWRRAKGDDESGAAPVRPARKKATRGRPKPAVKRPPAPPTSASRRRDPEDDESL